MSKLGTEKKPLCFHVRTEERIGEIADICDRHGWHFIGGLEPNEPEDIREVEYMLNPSAFKKVPRMKLAGPQTVVKDEPQIGRNCYAPVEIGILGSYI